MKPKAPHSDAAWFRPRTEAGWHKLRATDVTATAAASLFGVSPYMTAYDLFHRLAGNVEVVIAETERMTWGKRLQRAIADGICEDKGWRIIEAHPFLYARSPRFKGMGASPDFIIVDPAKPERGPGSLEIKNVDKFIAMDGWGEEEAPVHIEFQLQHQLEACRLGWGAIGGLIGGNTTQVYERDADAGVGAEIGRLIEDMHARVAANNPPAPDFLKDADTIKALNRYATVGKGLNLDVPEDEESATNLVALIDAKYSADLTYKAAKEDKQRADAELLHALGDTESVYGRGWKVSAGTVNREENVVTFPAVTYRNLRVSKPKGKK